MNKGVLRSFYNIKYILITLISFSLVIFLLIILKPKIERDMLFYFFSSIAQSMAALFAVVGMFAVFRFQNLSESIRNETLLLRKLIELERYLGFFENLETYRLNDEEFIKYLNKRVEEIDRSKYYLQDIIYVEVTALVLSSKIERKNYAIKFAMIPMVFILISFVESLISLLFISNVFLPYGSINKMGIINIWLIILIVLISMISILRYFKISFE